MVAVADTVELSSKVGRSMLCLTQCLVGTDADNWEFLAKAAQAKIPIYALVPNPYSTFSSATPMDGQRVQLGFDVPPESLSFTRSHAIESCVVIYPRKKITVFSGPTYIRISPESVGLALQDGDFVMRSFRSHGYLIRTKLDLRKTFARAADFTQEIGQFRISQSTNTVKVAGRPYKLKKNVQIQIVQLIFDSMFQIPKGIDDGSVMERIGGSKLSEVRSRFRDKVGSALMKAALKKRECRWVIEITNSVVSNARSKARKH